MSLLIAAKNNDWETVNQLFQDVASLEVRDAEGRNLLHWAAIHGRSDFLERHRDLLREDLVNTVGVLWKNRQKCLI
jgi:ankyrin repeat protein